jgi:hypothetical protein
MRLGRRPQPLPGLDHFAMQHKMVGGQGLREVGDADRDDAGVEVQEPPGRVGAGLEPRASARPAGRAGAIAPASGRPEACAWRRSQPIFRDWLPAAAAAAGAGLVVELDEGVAQLAAGPGRPALQVLVKLVASGGRSGRSIAPVP